MNKKIISLINKIDLGTHSDLLTRQQIIENVRRLPGDYIDFMLKYNGFIGYIGKENNYLNIWAIETVNELNPYYPNEEFSMRVKIIGSNGSGILYGYNLVSKYFFETDEFEMDEESLKKYSTLFTTFIEELNSL